MNKTIERIILIGVAILLTISVAFWMGLFAGFIPIGVSFAVHFASKASQSKERYQRKKYIILFIVSLLLGMLGAFLNDRYIDNNFLK